MAVFSIKKNNKKNKKVSQQIFQEYVTQVTGLCTTHNLLLSNATHLLLVIACLVIIIVIIIIIKIAPRRMKKYNENEWGDLECLYKAGQAPTTDGGVFTETGVGERGENE